MVDINNFLSTKLGRTTTLLTKFSYHDIAYPKDMKIEKYHSPLTCLDAMFVEYEDYDLFIFQGTTSFADCVADFKMALGIRPRQFKRALKFVKSHGDKTKPTIIAGHSLGGAITEYVIYKLKYKENLLGVTYNGAGVRHLVHKKSEKVNIYNYISSKDILNNITKRLPFKMFVHLGETLIIEDKQSKNGFESHGNFNTFQR